MPLIRGLLFPLSLIFHFLTQFRNWLYEKGIFKSFSFDRVIISVGNLTVGGTGKTPMTEYLATLLMDIYQVAFLSRGYKRKTKGFRMAGPSDDARSIGDEPFQFYRKFHKSITVSVGEARAMAIPEILLTHPETDIVVLDDGFQHRTVQPDINILLTDYHRLFYRDWLMPSGNLREGRRNARRADVVIVTKCPQDISRGKKTEIRDEVHKYASHKTPVFFAKVKYLDPVAVDNTIHPFSGNVFLFAGIAHAQSLVDYVQHTFNLLDWRIFPDHHQFSKPTFLEKVIRPFEGLKSSEKCLLTTEKDMVRLLSLQSENLDLGKYPIFYLPIQTEFLEGNERFNTYILGEIEARVRK